ncbi:glycosyltransferase [uncultured Desulfobacter sp.]|uniref:glycosyltransferase n=1 Tax=uncultured Desulfobacter sp. TaxID=240139 RepID=UPI002AA7A6C8|nr:glycosyltransferase [uncultured Desulfobacter sp.]
MTTISATIFVLSLLAISGFFFIYPLMILAASIFRYKSRVSHHFGKPYISMIIVVRNGEDLILKKIENAISIEYPSDQYEIIIFSDGSTDKTVEKVQPFLNDRIHLYKSEEHTGKFQGLNKAVDASKGDIIFFSDADAMLDPKAVVTMTKHFSDPQIGGVCGRRIIGEQKKLLAEAQDRYFSFDAWTKKIESRSGSITSNDGKLFAIRRDLFSPVPPGVTDDLYMALNIVKKKKRFVFESDALAFIRLPSRSVKHEIERRQRIVSTSLMGIFLMRDLLNPFEYGLYSLNLFLNKILRRLLPFFLVILFASNLYLSLYNPFYFITFFFQVLFYSMALIYPLIFQKREDQRIISRASSIVFYFCIGNIGGLFGVFNFLMGKRIVKWTPIKNDSQEDD